MMILSLIYNKLTMNHSINQTSLSSNKSYNHNYNQSLNSFHNDEGDWDDIVDPDTYDYILERKLYRKSNGLSAW
ncbi:gp84 [Synechococcus phage syn9]|uniref:Gp84 n=1 Tax=Synechococcus phage syn9 TaxID=382359 RepID=Q0QZE4_BPSYS|nr:gp84 [Synechococcus phage syn9]ABA47053.1 gp84 [Synechococcus phage syn9]